MFASAYSTATGFTKPVIISRVHFDGSCDAGVGAFVVVNSDGWVLTAAHIIAEQSKMAASKKEYETYSDAKNQIEQSKALLPDQKRKQIRKLGLPNDRWIVNYSFWWGGDGVNLVDVTSANDGDIAVGRLDPFDPAEVPVFPAFKDANKPIASGTSLCRLGFPFHQIQPTFANGKFQLPAGTFPMVFFPNEGILSRILVVDQDPANFAAFIETSSPGLPGQSGGPIFDTNGTIWGIQSHTSSLPLGFSPSPPGAKAGEKEHQFLNVGRGTHPITILKALDRAGARYTVAPY